MAVVADLVVNKPLGLSLPGLELKRAHLYDFNTVVVGAGGLASVLSVAVYMAAYMDVDMSADMAAHMGAFGPLAQAFSTVIATAVAFTIAPLIARATRGRYTVAKSSSDADGTYVGAYIGSQCRPRFCTVCVRPCEGECMAHCSAYGGRDLQPVLQPRRALQRSVQT